MNTEALKNEILKMRGTAKEFARAALIIARSGYVWIKKEGRWEFRIGELTEEEAVKLK